jgi:catechol 2,3-dioxygenase-like lactoylglutathione lyase family enzyme
MAKALHSDVRIRHAHLKVADLDRPLAFYRDVLGFELTQRYGDQAAFLSGRLPSDGTEILVEGNRITSLERSIDRPPGAQAIDLSDRTVSLGFIDTHVYLTMDAA